MPTSVRHIPQRTAGSIAIQCQALFEHGTSKATGKAHIECGLETEAPVISG